MTERTQIPSYTDRWMMGDRYGDITSTYYSKMAKADVARVKLDISGKTIRVLLDDCTPA